MSVRLPLFIVGIILTLMGVAWALQGAYILPATFMRGPEWVAIGAGFAVFGVVLLWLATRAPKRPQDDTRTSTES